MGLPPIENREVPSGIRPWPCVARIAVQRLVLRDRQDGHCRHSGVYSGMTWSPFLTLVPPAPTSTTMPAPSWPRIAGNRPSGSAPDRVNSSVWQMPVALSSTRTSPAFGPSRSTVSMASGAPALCATAALTFMDSSLGFVGWAKPTGRLRYGGLRDGGLRYANPPYECKPTVAIALPRALRAVTH